MRKKVFVWMCVLMMVLLCGISGLAAEQQGVEGEINIEESNQKLVFKSYAIDQDFNGSPVLALFFDYTNNSAEPKNAMTDFYVTVYQEGIESSIAFSMNPSYQEEYVNSTKNIKDGASLPICEYFSLQNTESPVEVSVKNFLNYNETEGRSLEIEISEFEGHKPSTNVDGAEDQKAEIIDESKEIKTYESEYMEMSEDYAELQSEYESLLNEYNVLIEKQGAALDEQINNTEIDEEKIDLIDIESMIQSELTGIEKNTNDSLNKVIEIARNDATTVTEAQINEAINVIRTNYPQYYNGPEQMELYMYYGYLLDFAFDDSDPRSELGMDLYQAMKYVYRGTETVLDTATRENLDQIEEDLQKIN